MSNKTVTSAIISTLLILIPGLVGAQSWIPVPTPPEMRGDRGYWWVDTGSFAANGRYRFFSLARSDENIAPPSSSADLGRAAMDCEDGQTFKQGICSGSCSTTPVFPDGWLKSTRYSLDSFLFETVCGTKPTAMRPPAGAEK